MIRQDEFLISRRPYAVDLSSLHVEDHGRDGHPFFRATVGAAWFRRRDGVLAACCGLLWDYQRERPRDAVEFLARHDDGRYGGDCRGRWDGTRYWGAQEPLVMKAHMELLEPMLDAYPAIPPGHSGWWRF